MWNVYIGKTCLHTGNINVYTCEMCMGNMYVYTRETGIATNVKREFLYTGNIFVYILKTCLHMGKTHMLKYIVKQQVSCFSFGTA